MIFQRPRKEWWADKVFRKCDLWEKCKDWGKLNLTFRLNSISWNKSSHIWKIAKIRENKLNLASDLLKGDSNYQKLNGSSKNLAINLAKNRIYVFTRKIIS